MSLPVKNLLPDNAFWKYFLSICSIPHPSGHEAKLREALIAEAEKFSLTCRVDSAGNLAIDRPAAKGFETAPTIILQAHLDMVPQAADGIEFDFLTDPIVPVVKDGWISTDNRTTLGADDGAGVALAMELLTDQKLQCGALRGVFTVSEETGLGGAEDIDQAFLAADYLINLDSDEPFTIGCAGGIRFEAAAVLPNQSSDSRAAAVKIELFNMHGGHSGEDIHKNVGSAVKVMGEFLQELSAHGFALARVDAGTLHNAIARSAEVVVTLPPENLAVAEAMLERYNVMLNEKFVPADGAQITMRMQSTDIPEQVLTPEAQQKLSALWNALPHGLLAVTANGDSQTSCNLAVIKGSAGEKWNITELARSINDQECSAVVNNALKLMQKAGFEAQITSSYSAWSPKWDSPFLEYACNTYTQLTGKTAQKTVIHGGLEPGMFCGMNPALDMISFAPHTLYLHSPQECMHIASAENTRKLLRKLVENIKEV